MNVFHIHNYCHNLQCMATLRRIKLLSLHCFAWSRKTVLKSLHGWQIFFSRIPLPSAKNLVVVQSWKWGTRRKTIPQKMWQIKPINMVKQKVLYGVSGCQFQILPLFLANCSFIICKPTDCLSLLRPITVTLNQLIFLVQTITHRQSFASSNSSHQNNSNDIFVTVLQSKYSEILYGLTSNFIFDW